MKDLHHGCDSGIRVTASPNPTLAFIAGIMRRSGTNYIARLLLEHPEVCRPKGHWELPLFEVADKYAEFHDAFLNKGKAGRLKYSLDDFARCFGEGLLSLLNEWVSPAAPAARYLLHKYPATRGIEHFRRFFPTAKLIFIVRDGRDNVNSLMVAAGFRGGHWSLKRWVYFYKFAREWAHSARRILDYTARPEAACLVVKYEDLYREPERMLERLSEYLNLSVSTEWADAARNIAVTGSGFYRPAGDSVVEVPGKAFWQKVNKTSQFKPIGRWRSSWSWLDKRLFTKLAGRELKELGYLD